ncbi:hypothetical protein ACQ4PT_028381 [Festuca glaucescens]
MVGDRRGDFLMADKGSLVATTATARSGLDRDGLAAAPRDLDKGKNLAAGSSSSSVPSGEAVADMMKSLNLTSKEADPLILDDEGDADLPCPEWALIGKVLSPNILHVNTIRAVVRPAWGNPKGLMVRPMGPNLFLAEFGSEADKSRVAKGGPWTLSRHAILLKDFDATVDPEDVVFNELPVWARIMKLGYALMNSERAAPIAARLGMVDRMEVDENGKAWGSYLRVRVSIDASEPIMRCVSVFSKKKNMLLQYDVMYEKLPIFCFSCGRLGHSSLLCPNPAERDADGKLPYSGDRLCVPEARKQEGSASNDQSQSSKSSRNGTTMGSGSQASTPPSGRNNPVDGTKEVSSPLKKPPRQRKPAAPRKTAASAAGKLVLSPGKDRVTGQTRKQTKRVYQPRLIPAGPVESAEGAMVMSGDLVTTDPEDVGLARVSEENSDDSNKKQRKDFPRSADLAEAVDQPRQPQ